MTIFIFAAVILMCVTATLGLSPWFYLLSAVVFLFCNICPSFRRGLGKRLKNTADGADLLCAFLVLLVPEIIFAIEFGLKPYGIYSSEFWTIAVIIWLSELIVFWNGIIRVYSTATMIGGKWRIIGLICGLIPVVHIIVLVKIIRLTRCEVAMEERRIRRNKERSGMDVCKTKYPIILVHGVFFRDMEKFNYWGRIPAELEKNGAQLYYGEQQSALCIADSAAEVAKKIYEVIEKTGSEKVNIIAHSKGGLDSRYAISCLGMDKYVASLTTVNTPHRGCVFAEWLLNHMPESFQQNIAAKYNSAVRLIGDTDPDFLSAVKDLQASSCEKFNKEVPDMQGIYYQSVGSKINKAMTSVFPLNFSHLLAGYFDGANDGLVTVSSSKWGEKFTYLESTSPDGVSHADVIDLLRHDKPDLDIREFYVQLVSNLKDKGL